MSYGYSTESQFTPTQPLPPPTPPANSTSPFSVTQPLSSAPAPSYPTEPQLTFPHPQGAGQAQPAATVPYGYPQAQPRRSASRFLLPILLMGGGVLILGVTLCFAAVWYVMSNVDRWVVGLGGEALVAMIDESDLPPGEKSEVIAQVNRVVTAYEQRKIDQADLERVMSELENSPVLSIIGLYGLDDHYLVDSGLSPEEQAQARRTFERVLRAVHEGKVSEDEVYACLPEDPLDEAMEGASSMEEIDRRLQDAARDAEGEWDGDVRGMFARFKALADKAGIPEEPYRLTVGSEVKRIVDAALAGTDA